MDEGPRYVACIMPKHGESAPITYLLTTLGNSGFLAGRRCEQTFLRGAISTLSTNYPDSTRGQAGKESPAFQRHCSCDSEVCPLE